MQEKTKDRIYLILSLLVLLGMFIFMLIGANKQSFLICGPYGNNIKYKKAVFDAIDVFKSDFAEFLERAKPSKTRKSVFPRKDPYMRVLRKGDKISFDH